MFSGRMSRGFRILSRLTQSLWINVAGSISLRFHQGPCQVMSSVSVEPITVVRLAGASGVRPPIRIDEM